MSQPEHLRKVMSAIPARVAILALGAVVLFGPGLPGLASAHEGSMSPGPEPAPAIARQPMPVVPPPRAQQAATATPTLTREGLLQLLMQQLDAAWNAQDWPEVLRLVEAIIAIDPNYDDIQDRRYYAHVNYGFQLLTEGQCTPSLEQFRKALQVRPQGQEALRGLELVGRYCATPAPGTATPTVVVSPTATVPGQYPTPTQQPLQEPITYTVQPGDTLYGLAKQHGTSVQAIMQANGMMDYFLRAGEVIWIPAGDTPPAGPIVHIVQPGETLYSIAQQYNTTVWAIMAANGLTSHTIWAYRGLFIPSVMQPGPIIHVVMPGETLYTIARRYGTTVPLIMLANGLSGYQIHVYQRLVIPPEGWTGWPSGWTGAWPGWPLHPGRTYVVQPGDTLYGIAQRFGTTVNALMAANGLTGSTIIAGSTLRIP